MIIIYAIEKPSRYDLTDLRACVEAALPGSTFTLFEREAHLTVEVDAEDALDAEATQRLKEAVAGYVYTPRAFVFPAPVRYDLGALEAAFMAAEVPGFTGMSADGFGNLRAEFPGRLDPFTPGELAALEAVVAGYTYQAPPYEYRRLRAAAYPPIGDQLDALWKGGAEAEAMKAQILAVKAAYPKPTT